MKKNNSLLLCLQLLFISYINAQCPTIQPIGVDGCNIGAGYVSLSASNSPTGLYSWYDAASGGNFLGNGSNFTTPYITSTTTYYVASATQNYDLQFDGNNDYVNLGNPPQLQVTGDMTIEIWLKPSNFSARRNPYAKAYGGEGTITQETNGTVSYYYGTGGGNSTPYQGFNTGASLTLNQWNHIAIVRNLTNMQLFWYINGVLVNQTSANYAIAATSSLPAMIGAGYVANYAGEIDEIRIWNVARTQSQIQSNMYQCLSGSETGLVAYYDFSDGSGSSVLTDKTIYANTGTLINFNTTSAWTTANYSFNCPFCESSRTPVVATINAGTPVNLGNDTCVSGNYILDAGAGYASYQWSTGATTQTISINTDGTYWVTVSDGSSCVSRDTITLTFIASPTANDVCRIGQGTVMLTASGSTGAYNWYASANSSPILANSDTFYTPVLNTTTTYYVSAVKPNSDINFNGSNYISIGNPSQLQITGDMTIEMWLKPSNFSARRNPYAKAYGGEGTITQETNGTVSYYYGTGGGNSTPYQGFNTGASLTLNQWNHIAIVRDLTNMKLYWYINGVLVNQTTANYANAATSSLTAMIGKGYVSNYVGEIDEVRIWNTARTASEITSSMTNCLTSNEPGLVLYYDFNEGTGNTCNDKASGLTGNIVNATSSMWQNANNGVGCNTCESARVPVQAIISAGTPVNLGNDTAFVCGNTSINLDAGAGYTSYLWNTGATSQAITITSSGEYWVKVMNGSCVDYDTIYVDNVAGAGNDLAFSGSGQFVSLGNPPQLQITGDMTIEMWLKPSNFSARRNPYAKAYGGEGTITQETNGTVSYYYGTGGGNSTPYQGFNTGASLILNQWNHIAIVRDLTNMKLYWYINGVLVNQTTANYANAVISGLNAMIGKGYVSDYAGEIDEVRIWNTARTQGQIRNNMCKTLLPNTAGLVAYYRFDKGTGSVLYDKTVNNLNGNIVSASWQVSGAPLGISSSNLYTSTWSGQSLNLSSCNGDNLTINNISGSISGIQLYYVDRNPSNISGITTFTSGNYYFGVFVIGSGSITYNSVYDYTNHPSVTASNESGLIQKVRNDANSTLWVDGNATLDINLNTLTISGNTAQRREFILDLSQFVWTGATSADWGTASNWNPTSVPIAGSNILIPVTPNNPILDINRNIGNLTIETNATLNLNSKILTLTKNFINNGQLLPNNGTVSFAGIDIQSISANSPIDFDFLEINNTNGVQILNGITNIYNTLTLNGPLQTNDSLTFISNAIRTARIAPITSGLAGISGKIIAQRYIDAGSTNWRFLTTPVQGTVLEDWDDDFVTSGFPGTDFPNWPSASNPWPNMYFYDETVPGIQDNGYVVPTSTSDPVTPGKGVWVWCGDTITGTQPFTIDVQGVANTGVINLPVSYTNSGNPADDGWSMVGNPYMSSLDWDASAITKTNINNAIYIWNPDLQQFASYVAGIGTNGGSRFIASSQAFWVQATASNPQLQIQETAKATNDAPFLRTTTTSKPMITLSINGSNGSDQTIVAIDSMATFAFDGQLDAYKLTSTATNTPSLSTLLNGEEYSINQINTGGIAIPVKITTSTSGLYQLSYNVKQKERFNCILLEDLYTGITHSLLDSGSYTIYLSDTTQVPRFILHIGETPAISVLASACYAAANGAVFYNQNSTFTDWLITSEGDTIHTDINIYTDSIYNLPQGSYILAIFDSMCGNINRNITIESPAPIAPLFTCADTIYLNSGGSVLFTNQTPNADTYLWDFGNGDTSHVVNPIYTYNNSGIYTVTLNAFKNECQEQYSKNISVLLTNDVNEIKNNELLSYLNNDKLYIILNNQKVRNLMLFNAEGKLIKVLNTVNKTTVLDLANYAKGLYILKYNFKGENKSQKFILN